MIVLACSVGYLTTLLYWGLQYEHVNTLGSQLAQLPRTIRAALDPDSDKLRSSNVELTARNPLIEWKLYGKEFMTDGELRNISRIRKGGVKFQGGGGLLSYIMRAPKAVDTDQTVFQKLPKGQLKSVSREFQQKLETSWPLNCHPGEEGLFPAKYERFARALQDYADFHQKTSPAFRTNNITKTDQARVLVWQCSVLDYCGGLADRMKGVAYALLLSMFSRRRLIINWDDTYVEPNLINWTDDTVYGVLKSVDKYMIGNRTSESDSDQKSVSSSNQRPSESNNQDYQNGIEDQDFIDDDSVADYARGEIYDKLGRLSEYPYQFRMFSIIGGTGIENSESDIIYTLSTIGGPSKYILLSSNLEPCTVKDSYKNGNQEWIKDGLKWVGLSHLSMTEIDNILGIVMRYLFRLKSSLLEEVASAGRTLALSEQLYTSLHVRTGFAGSAHLHETIKLPKFVRSKESWEAMLKCAVEKANSFLGPTSPILLATDSRIVKHMAVSKYGGRFRTLDNSLLHVDKMNKIPHLLEGNELEGVIFTWVDMFLLAESHVQVGGTSGYIWAASILCYSPSERKINGETCEAGHQF